MKRPELSEEVRVFIYACRIRTYEYFKYFADELIRTNDPYAALKFANREFPLPSSIITGGMLKHVSIEVDAQDSYRAISSSGKVIFGIRNSKFFHRDLSLEASHRKNAQEIGFCPLTRLDIIGVDMSFKVPERFEFPRDEEPSEQQLMTVNCQNLIVTVADVNIKTDDVGNKFTEVATMRYFRDIEYKIPLIVRFDYAKDKSRVIKYRKATE